MEKDKFDFYPYGTKTTKEVLKIVGSLNFKSYTLLKNKGAYLGNFFIWKKTDKGNEYLRLCLLCEGWNEKRVYSWSVEFNFKPFSKKKNKKWLSEGFKGTAEDLYFNRFLEGIEKIKKDGNPSISDKDISNR